MTPTSDVSGITSPFESVGNILAGGAELEKVILNFPAKDPLPASTEATPYSTTLTSPLTAHTPPVSAPEGAGKRTSTSNLFP